jgi:hypothetical protein
VDGCVIRGSLAADYVLSRLDCGDLIVELKGTSVEHAYKQIKATAKFWCENGLSCGRIAGVIICNQYPKILTKKQHAQEQFKNICRGPLHIINRNQEFLFEKLFEWRLYS